MKMAKWILFGLVSMSVHLHAIPWIFPETLLTRENPAPTVTSQIDSEGNAIAVWITHAQENPKFAIYNAAEQTWSEPETLDLSLEPANPNVLPGLCISENGQALVFWVRNSQLAARVRTGGIVSGTWEPPLDETPFTLSSKNITGVSFISADMNPAGEAAVAWSETRTSPYRDIAAVRRYVKGVWVPELSKEPLCLCDNRFTDTIAPLPSIRINNAGDLAIAWKFDLSIVGRLFDAKSGVWIPSLAKAPFPLSYPKARFPKVAIDAAGDMYAIWIRGEAVESVRTEEKVLQSLVVLGNGINAPDIIAGPRGVAAAIWPSLGEMIYSSIFSNGSWSTPPLMISQIGAANPSIDMDLRGNATAVWENNATGTVQMADLFRGVWQTPVDLFPIGDEPRLAKVALSSTGNTLVSWKTDHGTGEVAVCLKDLVYNHQNPSPTPPISLPPPVPMPTPKPAPFPKPSNTPAPTAVVLKDPPSSPVSVTGRQVRNYFGFVSELFHEVKWEPSAAQNVVGYQVFANNVPLGYLPKTAREFRDHNKTPGAQVIYQIRAVDAEGVQSHPLVITLP